MLQPTVTGTSVMVSLPKMPTAFTAITYRPLLAQVFKATGAVRTLSGPAAWHLAAPFFVVSSRFLGARLCGGLVLQGLDFLR